MKDKKALHVGAGIIIAFIILIALAIVLFIFSGRISDFLGIGGESAKSSLAFGGPT